MNHPAIIHIIFAVIGIPILITIGIWSATDPVYAGVSAAILVGIWVLIQLGNRIWLLIPLLGSMQLTLRIPARPSTLMVAEVVVIGMCVLLLLARRLPFKLKLTELEGWMVLLLLLVLQVYLRNPVSLGFLGGDQVGGRPYVLFIMAYAVGLILCGLRDQSGALKTAMKFSIIGSCLNVAVGFVGYLWMPVGHFFGVANVESASIDAGRATRVGFLSYIPKSIALVVGSFISPVRACFNIRWAPLVILSFGLAAVSGFRNVLASVGLTYLVAILYRGGLRHFLIAGLAGALALCGLAFVNLVSPLPANFQRSLSFLPGSWEQRHIDDAEDSTEWRTEIWKEVLFTDRWIENKILGDGLGFSAREIQYQAQVSATGQGAGTGVSGFDLQREYVMINGDYHSGPVSAVRTIGYVGLLVMVIFQIRLVVHAHRQIMRCRGTEWFPVTLFFCIPIIWYPFFFAFVFGALERTLFC